MNCGFPLFRLYVARLLQSAVTEDLTIFYYWVMFLLNFASLHRVYSTETVSLPLLFIVTYIYYH